MASSILDASLHAVVSAANRVFSTEEVGPRPEPGEPEGIRLSGIPPTCISVLSG